MTNGCQRTNCSRRQGPLASSSRADVVYLFATVPLYALYLYFGSRTPEVTLVNVSTSAITLDNFRKIKIGMTLKQIESFLGPKSWQAKNEGWEGDNPFPKSCAWEGKDISIDVAFDADGHAGQMVYHPKNRNQ